MEYFTVLNEMVSDVLIPLVHSSGSEGDEVKRDCVL